jgi:regulatory protein
VQESELVELYGDRVLERARNIILFQLSSSPKTRKQLSDKLASKEIPEDIVSYLLDRYEELNLIDDAMFAEMWVNSRHRSKGLGKRNLKQELKRKGVEDEYIDSALENISSESEYDKAFEICQKKYSRMSKNLPIEKQKQRLIGFLMRKGHSPSIVYGIVNQIVISDPDSTSLD